MFRLLEGALVFVLKINQNTLKNQSPTKKFCFGILYFGILFSSSSKIVRRNASRKEKKNKTILLSYYLAAPWPTLDHYQGDSLTYWMLITVFLHFQPEGHRKPRSEVGSLGLAVPLVGF